MTLSDFRLSLSLAATIGREMGQIILYTYKDPRSTTSSPGFVFRVTISTILAISCAILSLLAAQKSYIAIINLRKYEEKSERAAKYSQTAADQLWKTRVTQGSSASVVGDYFCLHQQSVHEAALGLRSCGCILEAIYKNTG